MRPFHYAWLVLTVLCGQLSSRGEAAEPFRYPEGTHGAGVLKYVNDVPVLVVQGRPEEMGEAIGALAMKPGRAMASYPEDMLAHFHVHWLLPWFVAQGRRMVEAFPAIYTREMEAIARASGVGRDQLVVGNTLFDLKKLVACSVLLVMPERSAPAGPVMARNLDYPSLGYAQEYTLVTIYRPVDGRHAFAAVGFPGLVGCLSGINDAGLTVAVLESFHVRVGVRKFNWDGLPYSLCYRRLLEECTTIAEAKELLQSMPRTTTTNLALADREGVAVFEVTPDHVNVRRPADGACVCTNHFLTTPLRPIFQGNSYETLVRFDELERCIAHTEKFDPPALRTALNAACNPRETLQSMIFEPRTLRLHLATGKCPSSAQEMKTLDLQPLLSKP